MKSFLATMSLGKEVIVKAFWLSWGQETGGDEKFSGYHVVRRKLMKLFWSPCSKEKG
jgi:hypothetical protein